MDTDKHRWKKEIRKSLLTVGICLLVYTLSYALNSFLGGYWLKPEMDGHDRYSFGLAMPTAIMWQPLLGHEAMGHLDYFGALYMPLIRLDRRVIHPTIYISDDVGSQKLSNLKKSQVHPHWRDEFATKIAATGVRDESGQAIRCTFRYTGSDRPREITEIRVRKELARKLDASPPSTFTEKPFENHYDEWLNEIYVRWTGRFSLSKDHDVILVIPAKQPQAGTGSIVFFYQRTDDASHDFKNLCSAELK
jgi:hypothetical protein